MTYFPCHSAEMQKIGRRRKKGGKGGCGEIREAARANADDRKKNRFCCDNTHTHTSRCAAAALDLCCSTQGDFRPKSLAENLAEISFCLDFLKTF